MTFTTHQSLMEKILRLIRDKQQSDTDILQFILTNPLDVRSNKYILYKEAIKYDRKELFYEMNLMQDATKKLPHFTHLSRLYKSRKIRQQLDDYTFSSNLCEETEFTAFERPLDFPWGLRWSPDDQTILNCRKDPLAIYLDYRRKSKQHGYFPYELNQYMNDNF